MNTKFICCIWINPTFYRPGTEEWLWRQTARILKVYDNIDKGLMNITPEELWEMQKDERIGRYLEYNKNFLQR
ncbi:MAG TPA: hypothetical protein PK604_11765 [Acetivibrio clariflavus]|nr:hypothetical protein [Acetivibrio clariflavus]HPU42137.1 hypothetical protein [Acetivibrio clariflavus]